MQSLIKRSGIRRWPLLLFAATVFLVGCGSEPKDVGSPGAAAKPQTVRLATSKNMWCALPLIAKSKGFFAEEKLDVQYNFQAAGRFCMDALVSGSADIANVVEVNVAYLGFNATDNVRVVATCVSSDGSAIVYRNDRGIGSPADLRGKTLALSPGTTSDIFANRILSKYRLGPTDVKISKVQPAAMQAAMVSGSVDAVSTWEPFASNIRKAMGSRVGEFRDSAVYVGYENVAVNKEWAQKNPTAVSAFLRALKKAEVFLKANPAEAQKIVAQEVGMELAVTQSTWKRYVFELVFDQDALSKAIAEEGTWIATQPEFQGKPAPDYSRYFDRSFFSALQK